MTTKTKILLAISLTSFALSSTGLLWGFFLPVGAITFGLFLVFNVLAKETALFEAEQSMRRALAESEYPTVENPQAQTVVVASAVPTH